MRKMTRYRKNDVVQFTEDHKWMASLGIISDIREQDGDISYLIGVPVPQQGTAYIWSSEPDIEFEYVGRAILGEAE